MTEKKITYKEFLEKLERKENIEFTTITCPFLIESKCSIYEKRLNCCRSFPNKNGICADYDCLLENNESNPEICSECGSACCNRILYIKNIDIDPDFVIELLDMDCETCSKYFEDYELDEVE